ncbi:dolichyl-phosphate beta-glucosyltransferase [Actinomadura namibiensis]|uniref:dolichyl-phosphate beta-glucosyltransferase n=1 Tax=Actinomadura namibiensis TaxID=182080 RepID=A0A7W3QMD5_ACTNM|nr:dolichyl-phosphate beta-glucosyltransferase [Actinomadura namibiensis]MBA8952452.1 dolichyl-phosphate beta-glucosyltransferase [Actinomadura namibiensis]
MNASSVELTVVIPAYNERDRLPATLSVLRAHLERAAGSWEVLVADDGSRDGTAPLVRAAARRDPRIRLLRSPANRGKGHAVRRGVRASRGRLVLVADADLATPPGELARLRAGIGRGYAAAIGSRRHARRHPARLLPALVGAAVIRRLAVRGFADTQCGFKLFDGDRARAVFPLARTDGWGFDVEILRLFAERGWPVAEVPVAWTHRAGSKLRPADYLRVLGEVAAIRLRHGPPPPPVPAPGARLPSRIPA